MSAARSRALLCSLQCVTNSLKSKNKGSAQPNLYFSPLSNLSFLAATAKRKPNSRVRVRA